MKGIFNLTDEGDISDYLGIKDTKLTNGHISLTQPHLINTIFSDLNFAKNTKAKDIPTVSASILLRDLEGEPFEEHWDFRSIVGKLNFSESPLNQTLPMQFINAPAFQQGLKNLMLTLYGRLSGVSMGPKTKE